MTEPGKSESTAPVLPIAIRHNQGMAIFMLLSALFILSTTFLLGVSLNTVTGVILLVVSIGFLTQPGIVVTASGFEFRNLLGMTLRRTDFGSLADVSVEDGVFYVKRGASKEKVIGMRWFLSGADIKRLEDAVRAAGK